MTALWGLWHFLADLGAEVSVRNNALSATEIIARNPEGILSLPDLGHLKTLAWMELILAAKKAGAPLLGVAWASSSRGRLWCHHQAR